MSSPTNAHDVSNVKTIVVMGAGIGGLTAAHELSHRGFKVHIYEQNDIVGGMARSAGKPFTGKNSRRDLPGEYCWRGYGTRYVHLLDLMRQIPVDNNTTVFDHLVEINTLLFFRMSGQKVCFDMKKNKYTTLKNVLMVIRDWKTSDIIHVLDKLLFSATVSDARIDSLDNIRWIDFINTKKMSNHARPYLLEMLSGFYGFAYDKVSTKTALIALKSFLYYIAAGATAFVMNAPTNDAWFTPWIEYLKKQHVEFHLNHEVLSFDSGNNNQLKSIIVYDKINQQNKEIFADYFVCSVSVKTASKLSESIKDCEKKAPSLFHLKHLLHLGEQHMFAVQFYFDQKISLEKSNYVIYLVDTPWQLFIEPQGDFWNIDLSQFGDGNIKQIWSVAIDSEINKGILFNKTASECTRQEIIDEVWAQIKGYNGLFDSIKLDGNEDVSELRYLDAYVWDSFQYIDGKLVTNEPKFSNNINTFQFQPSVATEINNLFFATAYTKVSAHIFSMEIRNVLNTQSWSNYAIIH